MAENGSALQALALSEELTPDERWKLGLNSSSGSDRSPDLPQVGGYDHYAGGAGWSPWASNAAGTAIGALGQFGGIPGPITSIAGGVAKSALGDEGVNPHNLANSGIGILAGMQGLGIPLSVAKIASKLAGEELDVSNLIGEWTGSYGLRSPRSLNLELFDKESDSAFQGLNQQALSFEGGLNLGSAEDVLSILDEPEEEGFDLGIPVLDNNGIIPRRKELNMFMAPRGRGKSWWITHLAKQAMLQRWSVVIITLEMSEKRYAGRMLQSFFSIARRDASVKVTRLLHDNQGNLQDLLQEQIERMTMKDPDIRQKLASRAKREFRRRPPIRIKQFPTGELTVAGVNAYLDGLERFDKFTPDLICIDYPDLMKINPNNLRVEIGNIIVGLRGIAVARNASMAVVTQGNRESESATLVTGKMAA